MKKVIGLALLFLCLAMYLKATPFVTATSILSDGEELQGAITHILQDHHGYIWVSTFNGINRYDGYQWTKFKSDQNQNSVLHSNRINMMCENSLGNLYCLTNTRLYLFNTDKELFVDCQKMLDDKQPKTPMVSRIYPLETGFSWLIGENGELFRLNDRDPLNNCQQIQLKTESSQNIYHIFADRFGYEWVLTANGTYRLNTRQDGTSLQNVSKMPLKFVTATDSCLWLTSSDGRFRACYHFENGQIEYTDYISSNGCIWQETCLDGILYSSSGNGFYLTDLETGKSERISNAVLISFLIDQTGRIWGFTEDMSVRLIRRSDGGKDYLTTSVNLPEDYAMKDSRARFHEDNTGAIWLLPFDSNRVLYFNGERFIQPEGVEKLRAKATNFLIDRQGDVWYMSNRRVDHLRLNNLPFQTENICQGKEVRSILNDSEGNIWYGSREKTIVVTDSTGQLLTQFDIEGTAYCLFEDSHQRIWIGSKAGGLFLTSIPSKGQKPVLKQFKHNENNPRSISNNEIYSVLEDSRGHLWIGTFGGGINLFDVENEQFYHSDNHLGLNSPLPNAVRQIREVRPGIVAVASREGLFTFSNAFDKPEDIHMFHHAKTEFDQTCIPDNDIMSLMTDSRGIFWLTTSSGGICRLMSDSLLSDRLIFKTITKNEGLASDVSYSIIEDNKGKLWVTSGLSLTRITLNETTRLPDMIKVYEQGTMAENLVFSEGTPLNRNGVLYFGTMEGFLAMNADEIVENIFIPPLVVSATNPQESGNQTHSTKNVSVRFTALDFHNNRNLKYAYRMDDLESDWKVTSDNSVTYINLPPRHHLFHVRSTNADGIWTDNEKTIDIYVKPTVFQTVFGKSCIILTILLMILFGLMALLRFYQLRHSLSVEKEMSEMKMRFFTDISHELRTPLTLVDGPVTEVLEDRSLSRQSRKYLEMAQNNVRRMLTLVNQILDTRKIENNKMKLIAEQLDLKLLMTGIMNSFQSMASQHRINFILECPVKPASVWADRDKLEKIFYNLLSNAFKFTPDGRQISISIADKDNSVEVAVSDQGIGIRQEDIPHLFQRFETVLQNNLFKPSSGIGLALVKQFADMHHAVIRVESREGEGSTFTLAFLKGRTHLEDDPKVEFYVNDMVAVPQDSDQQSTMELEYPETETDKDKDTILIVEDNGELRDFMTSILEKSYRVITATNGEEGLRAGKEFWPDVIVTDLMMPRMDGFEMIRHIKEDPDIYSVPVIVLTAKTAMDDRIRGIQMGVDDYVLKPFSANYLKTRVAALIEQRRMLKKRYLEMLSQGNAAKTNLEPDMPEITPADELFVQGVMAFMEKNMDNPDMTIDEFANAMRLGRTVFYNKLKSTLGLTPIDFVQEIRIKRAVQLMKTGDLTISEIAYKTGFNDPKYFSRCFKKHVGQSPSDFIKSQNA